MPSYSNYRRPVPRLPPASSLPFPANLIRECSDCNLRAGCTAPVPSAGRMPARILLVGEAPGVNEDLNGKPFWGAAGKQLDSYLFQNSIIREDIHIANVVCCRPPGNRKPKSPEISACSKWLTMTVDLVNPDIVVAMGEYAIKWFLGQGCGTVEHLHGKPQDLVIQGRNRVLLPAYHPAAALYTTTLLRQTADDFAVLGGLARDRSISEYNTVDEYPNPVYRVADTPKLLSQMRDEIIEAGQVAIDTETVNQNTRLWSAQYSSIPGTGWFVPISPDFKGRIDLSIYPDAQVIVHHYLSDIKWLDIPERNFFDSMVAAYLLGQAQGLKELASRLCGIRMTSYLEVVRPGQRRISLDYLNEAAKHDWGDSPDVPETKWDNKAGKVVTKIHHPWNMNRKINKLLSDMAENSDTDPYQRWRDIPDLEKARVEEKLGIMPESSLADIPFLDAVDYACLSGESKVLMGDGKYKRIGDLVRTRSTDEVMSWDSELGFVPKKINGWYSIPSREKVNWWSVKLDCGRPHNGGWGHTGTRYTSDHKLLTKRGWVEVRDLVVGKDEVALPITDLTWVQRQLVIGSILGDGSLGKRNANGWSCLKLSQGYKQEQYLRWKTVLMGELCKQQPKPVKQHMTRTPIKQEKAMRGTVSSESIHHPVLELLRRQAYVPNKNISGWVDDIDALALAIFYMDDGTLVKGTESPRLYPCDFDPDSIDYLRGILDHKWGIRSSRTLLSGRTDQYQLHILAPYDSFWSVVAPYIHPSMQYKLPEKWRGKFYDLLIDESPTKLVYSLVTAVEPNPCSKGRRGSIKTKWCIDVEDTHNFVTLGEIAHNCRDAQATLRVKLKLEKLLSDAGLGFVFNIDTGILPMVNDMMKNGMAVDLEHFKRLSAAYTTRMAEKAEEVAKIAGHSFNPNSSLQVAQVVYTELGFTPTAKTPSGEISTDDSELKKTKHPIAKGIIQYRGLLKLKSTYADNMIRSAHQDAEGVYRMHTVLKTTRVETGRLSSAKDDNGEGANLQNIPIRNKEAKQIKRGFIAALLRLLMEGDLGQVEMRTQAHLAMCKGLIELFLRGDDPHTVTASKLFGVPYEEAKKDKYRYPCKRAGFGIIYLIGAEGLSSQINEYIADLEMDGEPIEVEPWDVDTCERFIKEYYTLYPEIRDYQMEKAAEARRYGYTTDMFGRRRFIPEVNSPVKSVQEAGLRQAANFPVTASAQEIIKSAMIRLWQELPKTEWANDVHWLMQIHDSLVVEVSEDERIWKPFAQWMRNVMCNTVKLVVPITADIKVGKNWADMEKVKRD